MTKGYVCAVPSSQKTNVIAGLEAFSGKEFATEEIGDVTVVSVAGTSNAASRATYEAFVRGMAYAAKS